MDDTSTLPPLDNMKQTADNEAQTSSNYDDSKSRHKKLLLITGAVVAAVLLGLLSYFILTNISGEAAKVSVIKPQPTPIPRGRMWFSTSEVSEPTSTLIDGLVTVPTTLTLIMDGNEKILNGADAVLLYDPALLEVVSFEPSQEAKNIFNVLARPHPNEDGKYIITAFKTQYDDTPTGILTLGTLTLKPKSSGTSSIDFEHKPGKTVGSTIIQAQNDENVLDAVYGTTLTVQ